MRIHIAIAAAAALAACGTVDLPDRVHDGRIAPDPGESREAKPPLSISVLDVGQGDSALIIAPSGESMLIDAGPSGQGAQKIAPKLNEEGITRLSAAVITHYHEDHFGGLSEIEAGSDGVEGTGDDIEIGGIYERLETGDSGSGPLGEIGDIPDCPRQAVSPGQRIELGDASLEVLAANSTLADGTEVDPGDPADENAMGIAMRLDYGEFSMLFAADITGGGGEPPYDTPDIETPLAPLAGDLDALKVAHHGSGTSSNQAFLDATRPELAIISVGDGNDYFQPHDSAIERLLASGAAVYQTERGWLDLEGPTVVDGDIEIEVDEDGEYRVIIE